MISLNLKTMASAFNNPLKVHPSPNRGHTITSLGQAVKRILRLDITGQTAPTPWTAEGSDPQSYWRLADSISEMNSSGETSVKILEAQPVGLN